MGLGPILTETTVKELAQASIKLIIKKFKT